MSKWCDTCHRNEFTGKWKSCGADCPVFGKNFEDLAKIVVTSGLYDGELCTQQTRKFFDTETREIITEDVLAATLEELKECDPDTYGNITLAQYINNCLTIHNGTLEEI